MANQFMEPQKEEPQKNETAALLSQLLDMEVKAVPTDTNYPLAADLGKGVPLAFKTLAKLNELQDAILDKLLTPTQYAPPSTTLFFAADQDGIVQFPNKIKVIKKEIGKEQSTVEISIIDVLKPYKKELSEIIRNAPQEAQEALGNKEEMEARKQKAADKTADKEEKEREAQFDLQRKEEQQKKTAHVQTYVEKWLLKDGITVKTSGPGNDVDIIINCASPHIANKLCDQMSILLKNAIIRQEDFPITANNDGTVTISFDESKLGRMGNQNISKLMAGVAQEAKEFRALKSIPFSAIKGLPVNAAGEAQISATPLEIKNHNFVFPKNVAEAALKTARDLRKTMKAEGISLEKTQELGRAATLDGNKGVATDEEVAALLLAKSVKATYLIANGESRPNEQVTEFDGTLSESEFTGKGRKNPAAVEEAMAKLILAKTYKVTIADATQEFNKAIDKSSPTIVTRPAARGK